MICNLLFTYIYSFSTTHCIAIQMPSPRIRLVEWDCLPSFVREACNEFPFRSTAEAQVFSDLLMARLRGLVVRLREMDDDDEDPHPFLWDIEHELVCSLHFVHCFCLSDLPGLVSRSQVCRAMLPLQFSDHKTGILCRGISSDKDKARGCRIPPSPPSPGSWRRWRPGSHPHWSSPFPLACRTW